MSGWLRGRRHLDRVVAVLLGPALVPVIAVAALAVWLEDRKMPVIGLRRVGQHGRIFRMWKLRSMTAVDSSGRAGGPALTAFGDDRVTPVGRTLRRWRLDELPQLWNVLVGEMALIGPRPETPEFVDLQDPSWNDVLAALPGIAGPTQLLVHTWEARALMSDTGELQYREEILPVKLEVDAWYVANATPAIDVAVLADLLFAFVSGGRPRWTRRHVTANVPRARRIPQSEPS